MAPAHWGKNAVIVLALIGAGFFAAWLRFRPFLGNEGAFSDGTRTYDVRLAEEVRFAVWDAPEVLAGDVNTNENEWRPALSPDGRHIVFVVGEAGLGSDLWIADMVGERAVDPRPLAALNTAADELAPCFAGSALYFSSNRRGTKGGLDIWRVSYDRGQFGVVEELEDGINTKADETDPTAIPGSENLIFASNRARARRTDFDLYTSIAAAEFAALAEAAQAADPAAPDAATPNTEPPVSPGATWVVRALDNVNSPFDEREPALTSDGRTLFFASDRDESLGGFDLYRSAQADGVWLAPLPLVGVNTTRSERGPSPLQDGFGIVFAQHGADDTSDLFRARSRELFRLPGKPVGWREFLVLALLLLIALLAWLAKQWEQIEILYKCVLVSLVAHLILLWYLHDVYPEGGTYELKDGSGRMRVRLIGPTSSAVAANTERGGDVAAQRSEDSAGATPERVAQQESRLSDSQQPSAAQLERTPAPLAAAPERQAQDVAVRERAQTPQPAPTPILESFARRSGAASELVHEAQGAAPRAEQALAQAEQRNLASELRVAAAPNQVQLERGDRMADAAPAAQRRPEQRTLDLPVDRDFETVEVVENFALKSAPAPELEHAVGFVDSKVEAGEISAQRSRIQTPDALAGSAAQSEGRSLELATSSDDSGLDPLAGHVSVESQRAVAPVPVLDDTPSSSDFERISAATSQEQTTLIDAPASLDATSAFQAAELSAAPSEAAATPRMDTFELAPSTFQAELSRPDRSSEPLPQRSQVAQREERSEPLPQVAERFEDAQPRIGEGRSADAPAFEPDADLLASSSSSLARAEDRLASELRPERVTLERETRESGPSFRPLAAAEALVDDDVGLSRRLEQTPYRSRVGPEKLRALEVFGGSTETERAVAQGLAYLASIQRRQGYWGDARDRDDKYGHVAVGKTALCMLAFMGAGHTQESGSEYSRQVRQAIDFLLAVQDEDTGHFGYTTSYSHAIATYALAECFALTEDPRLERPLVRAVRQITRHQNKRDDRRFFGGWGYYYPDGRTFDRWPRASVTAWQVMALESARLGGLDVDDDVFRAAQTFLRNCWDDRRQAYRYSHDPDRLNSSYDILPGSTPATLFALSILGDDIRDSEFDRARYFLLDRKPDGYRYSGDDAFVHRARGNLYFWYYGSLALFRTEGAAWDEWNAAMKETLLPSQASDGSWRPISSYSRYAGDDDDDRSYSTAMCVLTLEVYYRYFTPLLTVR